MSSDDSDFVDSDALDKQDEASAAECYDDDAFDDYSDSFESDGGSADARDDGHGAAADSSASTADASSASARESRPSFELGDRVQAYWEHMREWFSGRVVQVDDSRSARRYFVEYDDGEVQWETNEHMRCSPEVAGVALGGFQQLQLLIHSLTSVERASNESAVYALLLHANVLVHWRDSASWFAGSIAEVDVHARALRVEYDDGDERWEHDCDFVNILVRLSSPGLAVTSSAVAPASAPVQQSDRSPPPPPAPLERVLTPRAYSAVVERHFQPERTPRPYVSVTTTIGSILTPRTYCERRYLHAKIACECETTDRDDTRDALIQTDIPGAIDVEQHVYSPCC